MNNLTLINKNQTWYADSREVAEMVEKEHKHLLRDIENYIHILENPTLDYGVIMRVSDFFQESSYQLEGSNRKYKCYLITRKGCDMIANKMTGEKGVLFTATYVTKFEEMENVIKTASYMPREITKVDVSLKIAESVFKELRLPDTGKIKVYSKICDEYEVGKEMLPAYVDEKVTKSLTELLKQFGSQISTVKVNRILLEEGILEEKTRPSKKSGTKTFYSLTEKGLEFGKNLICPANALETQPHYYEDKFGELLAIIEKNQFKEV